MLSFKMESVLSKIRFLLFEQPGGTFHPNGECFFSRKEARDNGYVYISLRTPWHANPTTTTVHRAAKMLQQHTIFLEKKLDASHLCHNGKCYRLSHISLEPRHINLSRRLCVAANQCQGHGDDDGSYPNCLLDYRVAQ